MTFDGSRRSRQGSNHSQAAVELLESLYPMDAKWREPSEGAQRLNPPQRLLLPKGGQSTSEACFTWPLKI